MSRTSSGYVQWRIQGGGMVRSPLFGLTVNFRIIFCTVVVSFVVIDCPCFLSVKNCIKMHPNISFWGRKKPSSPACIVQTHVHYQQPVTSRCTFSSRPSQYCRIDDTRIVLLALSCCCPERTEIVSVLPFPKVWKETIDSTRVYSSVVGWRQVHSSSDGKQPSTNDLLNNNAINGESNPRTSLTSHVGVGSS